MSTCRATLRWPRLVQRDRDRRRQRRGRLTLGAVADRLAATYTFQLSVDILGVSYVIWYVAPGYAAVVGFGLALGVGYGGWVALLPSVMADLFGLAGLGGSLGAGHTRRIGALLGPPAGFLVDVTGSYRPAIPTAIAWLSPRDC